MLHLNPLKNKNNTKIIKVEHFSFGILNYLKVEKTPLTVSVIDTTARQRLTIRQCKCTQYG